MQAAKPMDDWIELDWDELYDPCTQSTAVLPAAEFRRDVRHLSDFGAICKITMSKGSLKLSTYCAETRCCVGVRFDDTPRTVAGDGGGDDPPRSLSVCKVTTDREVQVRVKLCYLRQVAELCSLTDKVYLLVEPERPLMIWYYLAGVADAKFLLATVDCADTWIDGVPRM